MNRRHFIALAPCVFAQPAERAPVRRSAAFFGLHFDLHPNKSDTVLGRDVTDEMVRRLLDRVKPDYVQYDCKGHAGWLGYPDSEVSPSAPGIVRDSLEVWRRQTARRGIALFIHFSGVWDSLAVQQHPEWARVGPDGKPDKDQTSTFGPYVDERMIPQLREAASRYQLDGAWVDGECWATKPDYSAAAVKAWGRPVPKGPQDEGWLEFLEFNRERFRRYVRHYIGEIHQTHPSFQIASNWLYTTYVPERPEIPVDFVSGDYLGNAAISAARLEARYLANAGLPWDLMAWGFQSARNNPVGVIHKPAPQLMQEAAVVIGQGGGFQVYYHPPRAGGFDDRLIATMGEVADFCRARQTLSHKSETVPQIGVLFSGHSLYRTSNKLFGGWPRALTDPARGLLDALLEAHYSVDVLPDWKLETLAAQYPLIAVPEWLEIGEHTASMLRKYLHSGGRLLAIGAENARLFADDARVRVAGDAKDQPAFVKGHTLLGNVRGRWQDLEAGTASVIEQRYATFDTARDASVAAVLHGRLALIPGPVSAAFAQSHDPSTRQFIARVIGRMWQPAVRVEAPPTVDISLRRKGARMVLHLTNSTGMQVAGDYAAVDFIAPAGPLGVSIDLPARPREVRLEPAGRVLPGIWNGSAWSATIDKLDIHAMVTFDVGRT